MPQICGIGQVITLSDRRVWHQIHELIKVATAAFDRFQGTACVLHFACRNIGQAKAGFFDQSLVGRRWFKIRTLRFFDAFLTIQQWVTVHH